MKNFNLKFVDFIPAISGIIGKIALTSSFALMWAQALGIIYKDFVFENVRIEILIGSIITLIVAIVFPKASPAGTLSPLIVLIPIMAAFGVHPLVLGISVGIIGLIVVKTGILKKLTEVSGFICRNSLTLAFGISGILLCIEKLYLFFEKNFTIVFTLIAILFIFYAILFKNKKTYLIIIIASAVGIIAPIILGFEFNISFEKTNIILNPAYWWNNIWGIGFGFDFKTIIKTLPFAFFVVLLWTIDIAAIQVLQESNQDESKEKNDIDINKSYTVVSIRNIAGSLFGGAQTGSLWRSFLIPLFMVKRPERISAIIMGVLGLLFSFAVLPIKVLSYPPLVWSVLLFAIFVPFTVTSICNIKKSSRIITRLSIIAFSLFGIFINPILTWIISVIYEKVMNLNEKQRNSLLEK